MFSFAQHPPPAGSSCDSATMNCAALKTNIRNGMTMKIDRHHLLDWSKNRRLQIFNTLLKQAFPGIKKKKSSAERLGIPLFCKLGIIKSWLILKWRKQYVQLQKWYLGELIVTVKQLPLGIIADILDCRCIIALVWLMPALLYLVCISLLNIALVLLFHPWKLTYANI